MSVLELQQVKVVHRRADGEALTAVAGASFSVNAGEIVALVGESGCGKSSLARACVGLVPIAAGQVLFEGKRLEVLRGRRPKRQTRLQMVFQDPYSSVNPRRRIGDQVADALTILGLASPSERARVVVHLLQQVGLPPAVRHRFPHELSGGQRQRVAIARALATQPSAMVLDEPLSALDASVQAQIVNLLIEIARDLHVAMLLISHDLAILRHIAHRTVVMYLGHVVEEATTVALLSSPLHPYSRVLLDAIPLADGKGKLPKAPVGDVPDPANPPSGCPFHPRCPHAFARCREEMPPLIHLGQARRAACWLHVASGPAASFPAVVFAPPSGREVLLAVRGQSSYAIVVNQNLITGHSQEEGT